MLSSKLTVSSTSHCRRQINQPQSTFTSVWLVAGENVVSYTGVCGEEDFEVLAAGEDGVLRDPVEEAMEGFPPRLDEVFVEAFHHALHDKLLWQGLSTGTAFIHSSMIRINLYILYL